MSEEAKKLADAFCYNIIPTKEECPVYTGPECMRTSLSREEVELIFDAGVKSVDVVSIRQDAIDWIQNATKKSIADENIKLKDELETYKTKFKNESLHHSILVSLNIELSKELDNYKWHDLEEDPTDLPEVCCQYVVVKIAKPNFMKKRFPEYLKTDWVDENGKWHKYEGKVLKWKNI